MHGLQKHSPRGDGRGERDRNWWVHVTTSTQKGTVRTLMISRRAAPSSQCWPCSAESKPWTQPAHLTVLASDLLRWGTDKLRFKPFPVLSCSLLCPNGAFLHGGTYRCPKISIHRNTHRVATHRKASQQKGVRTQRQGGTQMGNSRWTEAAVNSPSASFPYYLFR